MKLLIFLSFLVGAIRGQTNNTEVADEPVRWGGCYDESRSLIKKGKKMFLCLHVANSKNWSAGVDFIRLTFSPEADEYSRLHVPKSFRDLRKNDVNEIFIDNDLTVGVAVQESVSFLKLWAEGRKNLASDEDPTKLKIYPHLTAIIDVRDGVVKGITWDDACIFCGGFECDPIMYDFNGNLQTKDSAEQPVGGCGTRVQTCQEKDQTDNTDCDLVLYVVWTGTDVDGKAMLSSANRFSAFPAQELQDRLTRNLPGRVREVGTDINNGGDSNNNNRDL